LRSLCGPGSIAAVARTLHTGFASMLQRLVLTAALLLAAQPPLCADDAEDAAAKTLKRLGASFTTSDAGGARTVVGVDLAGVAVVDADLKNVAALPALRSLDISVCIAVTDAGMKHLAGLKHLETLSVAYTGVTDAGVRRLTGFTELRTLSLAGDRVTDEGLKALTGMTKLKSLVLTGTQATDQGVAELQKTLPGCKIDR